MSLCGYLGDLKNLSRIYLYGSRLEVSWAYLVAMGCPNSLIFFGPEAV